MTYKYERKYPVQCPFLRATGLDRGEAWQLQVGDIIWRDGCLCVHIREYRYLDQVVITEHLAPVVPGQEQAVLQLVEGVPSKNACLAARRSRCQPGTSCTRCGVTMRVHCTCLTAHIESCQGRGNARSCRRGITTRRQPERSPLQWVAQMPIR